MANPSKAKGDRAELAAVKYFCEQTPDLCVPKAMRKLGAGRAEDTGDLHVFPDVAVQVRAYKIESIGAAVRSSALDSVIQAGHGDLDFALGMVPYPRARPNTVKWIAATTPEAWPVPLASEPVEFRLISKALSWVRDDGDTPHRRDRIALLRSGSTAPVYVAPVEAWIEAYRTATNRPAPVGPVPHVRARHVAVTVARRRTESVESNR